MSFGVFGIFAIEVLLDCITMSAPFSRACGRQATTVYPGRGADIVMQSSGSKCPARIEAIRPLILLGLEAGASNAVRPVVSQVLIRCEPFGLVLSRKL